MIGPTSVIARPNFFFKDFPDVLMNYLSSEVLSPLIHVMFTGQRS